MNNIGPTQIDADAAFVPRQADCCQFQEEEKGNIQERAYKSNFNCTSHHHRPYTLKSSWRMALMVLRQYSARDRSVRRAMRYFRVSSGKTNAENIIKRRICGYNIWTFAYWTACFLQYSKFNGYSSNRVISFTGHLANPILRTAGSEALAGFSLFPKPGSQHRYRIQPQVSDTESQKSITNPIGIIAARTKVTSGARHLRQ
jgi:hypothetical protein